MTHSPEPWGCHDQGTPEPTICKEREDGTCHEIAVLTGCQGMSHDELIANGERIIACVNACAGIPTETLQEIARQKSPESIEEFNEIMAQDPLRLITFPKKEAE